MLLVELQVYVCTKFHLAWKSSMKHLLTFTTRITLYEWEHRQMRYQFKEPCPGANLLQKYWRVCKQSARLDLLDWTSALFGSLSFAPVHLTFQHFDMFFYYYYYADYIFTWLSGSESGWKNKAVYSFSFKILTLPFMCIVHWVVILRLVENF